MLRTSRFMVVGMILAGEVCLCLSARVPVVSTAQQAPAQITWTFDRLDNIGGNPTHVLGNPKLIDSRVGKAVEFNGIDDQLFIDKHPLAGAATFTFEAIFRPDGGNEAQRWFHLAERDSKTGLLAPAEYPKERDMHQRFLFELRTRDDLWWLDAFVTGGGVHDYRSLLLLEDYKHPVGKWYAVAQTYDGKMHRSYVNGALQGELPLMAYVPMGEGGTSVGARANKSDYFRGAVRQARFTHRALTPGQFLRVPIQK